MAKIRKKTTVSRSVDVESLGFQVKEAYKTARSNIEYSIIKKGCKKIAFTSSAKSEGKSVTACNVAYSLAQKVNTRVLIIDCDLRRPTVHSTLEIDSTPGLANYLNNECELKDVIKDTKNENLKAICFGVIPPNPSELLASEAMMEMVSVLEKEYDYIIFDTPPIGVVIDCLPIVKSVDGVVVVVRNEMTTYPEMEKTIEALKRAKAKILGVIVNRVRPTGLGKYGGRYGQYNKYEGYY